ncbi:MAG: hypothetical protein L0H94_06635 [Nitrospira sp.]|nr:hypothetical protein [Nitrospira sp.]
MAQYKPIHTGLKLLPVDFDQQVIPGSFEQLSATWSITNSTSPNSTPTTRTTTKALIMAIRVRHEY